jgi:hypothetical protein
MEKLIARWSYWLGMACLVIAVIWRIVSIFRSWQPSTSVGAGPIGHLAFMHGSILFLVATIATTCHIWLNSQKP